MKLADSIALHQKIECFELASGMEPEVLDRFLHQIDENGNCHIVAHYKNGNSRMIIISAALQKILGNFSEDRPSEVLD